jgi:predicted nucleic acid-binding protein
VPGGYLLDTNVLSETRRTRPNGGVIAFLAGAESAGLFLSVLTLGELRKCVKAKSKTDPDSADLLSAWVDTIETQFADRLLVVDGVTARLWGELSAVRSLPVIDTLIAATAIRHGLTLVTRNTNDFKSTGTELVDPWQS